MTDPIDRAPWSLPGPGDLPEPTEARELVQGWLAEDLALPTEERSATQATRTEIDRVQAREVERLAGMRTLLESWLAEDLAHRDVMVDVLLVGTRTERLADGRTVVDVDQLRMPF